MVKKYFVNSQILSRKKHLMLFFKLSVCTSLMLVLAHGSTSGQVIIRTSFNKEQTYHNDYRLKEKWQQLVAKASDTAINATASWGNFGTVDIANTVTPSQGLKLEINKPSAIPNWSASLHSGLLNAVNKERNLAKLTFSFDHWVSALQPVLVQIESYDVDKMRTGGLQVTLYPAAINHYTHSAIELADMKAFGDGAYNPQAPFVSFTFSISPSSIANDTKEEKQVLQIDNVMFASPAFYVSASGKDSNNGRTEQTAFATPQKALDVAGAGDIILLMNGRYGGAKEASAVANFKRGGQPSGWLTLKNYPGHQPIILCHGKDGINMAWHNDTTAGESPLLAYVDVRGIHIKGNADEVPTLFPAEMGYSTKNTETRGIFLSGKNAPTRMYHHIRIANCVVELCGTDGIWASEVDYLTLENNIIRNNCFTTVGFAMAGFSLMMYADFDKVDNRTKIVIRNNQVYGNQRKVGKKEGTPVWFNGNGMLFDANREEYIDPDYYLGRTLIQNNLVYGNGGGGIQNWGCHRLDIINNTIYHNGITPELKWGNIGLDFCQDVRIINNIIVALADRPLDTWMVNRADKNTAAITRINNLYYGGAVANISGYGDIVADPMFKNPSLDPAIADFRLKPGSPAFGKGMVIATDLPYTNIEATQRFATGTTINIGAF